MVDTHPRTPLPTTITYLVGAFAAAPAGDLSYHLTGFPTTFGGFPVLVGSMVAAELLRRDHPTGVIRRRGDQTGRLVRSDKDRTSTRDGTLIHGAWMLALWLGWLVAIPAAPPIVSEGIGFDVSVIVGVVGILASAGLVLLARRRERSPQHL